MFAEVKSGDLDDEAVFQFESIIADIRSTLSSVNSKEGAQDIEAFKKLMTLFSQLMELTAGISLSRFKTVEEAMENAEVIDKECDKQLQRSRRMVEAFGEWCLGWWFW